MKLIFLLLGLLFISTTSPAITLLAGSLLFYIGLPLLLTWCIISLCSTKKG